MNAKHLRQILTSVIAAIAFLNVTAQEQKNATINVRTNETVNGSDLSAGQGQQNGTISLADHLNAALSVGTTGIGIDLSMPINETFRIRAGFSIMPPIRHTANFKLTVGNKAEKTKYDKNGNPTPTRFERLSNMFYEMSGYKLSQYVGVYGEPCYHNTSLLVDIFPFHNKKWFLTGGIYYGNKTIAKAYNKPEAGPTLFSVGMYNNMVERGNSGNEQDYILKLPTGGNSTMDVDLRDFVEGREKMGFQLGDYFLVPDENAMVKASVQVNRLKPYLGFGYGDYEPKANKRYGVMLEFGVMWWGGTPRVDCYGTDLTTQHVKGEVGKYINVIKALKVFPVLNIRFSRRIF